LPVVDAERHSAEDGELIYSYSKVSGSVF
jgi:hypothetical protein